MSITIQQQIKESGRALEALCLDFLNQFSPSELPEVTREVLLGVLSDEGIVSFSRKIRGVMIELRQNNSELNSTQFWFIIDTIGFWEDAHPGRWKYTQANNWSQCIRWVNEAIAHFQWHQHTAEMYYASFMPEIKQ